MRTNMMKQRFLHLVAACLAVCAFSTAAHGVKFEWVPIGSTVAPQSISGNNIVLTGGTQQNVTLEFRISGWAPPAAREAGAYQGALDCAGYTSGSGGALSALTSPNADAGAFIAAKRCTSGGNPSCTTPKCTGNPQCPGASCQDNPCFIFTGFSPLTGVNTSICNYEFGATVSTTNGPTDGGLNYYAGTLILVVPSNARGTYTIDFVDNQNNTFLIDINGVPITPLVRTPAHISIACATGVDCSDNNLCTSDVCNPDHTCSNPNNYNPATQCCNVANGATMTLSDSNSCTGDQCVLTCVGGGNAGNPCSTDANCPGGLCRQNGQVAHPPLGSGTSCGNPNPTSDCDLPDTCNASGVCLSNPKPAGTACGNQIPNTFCDPADTCNGAGVCNNNRLNPGTPCGNSSDTDCTDPDTCNSQGVCAPNDASNGTVCSDNDACTQGEACSNGQCLGGQPVICDDGLSCTQNNCSPSSGCNFPLIAGNCLIANACYADGQRNPADDCQECDPSQNTGAFTQLPTGTTCDDGNPCTGTGGNNGEDTCDSAGVCSGQPDPECNDTCSTAVEVFAGTNSGFNNSAASPTDDREASCQPDSNKDIWFFYDATCTGKVFVSTNGSSMTPSNDSVLSIYSSCTGAELACDDDSGIGLHAALIFDATVGVRYFIRVAGFEDNQGDVVVNISTVAGCFICEPQPIGCVCHAEDAINPNNDCEICLPDVSTSSWSPRRKGSACGSSADTRCDSPDACDGAGVCEPNHKPDGTTCPDDGLDCTDDRCNNGECAHPPLQAGTACGDHQDYPCDNPDTCDGMGACLDNLEAFGFACGNPHDDQCDNPDICDGKGSCVDNFELNGTPCNDNDFCTRNDVCTSGMCVGIPIPEPPTVMQMGPRGITVKPNPAGNAPPVALHLTSPTWPCLSLYVQPGGTLAATPVFLSDNAWGTVIVKGVKIVPSSIYQVRAECGSYVSGPGSASTCLWGDIDCSGVVNFTDIQILVLGFQGNFNPGIPFAAMDIDPCTPQGVLNFTDIQRDVLAFLGQTYAQTGCPLPCP